MFLFQNPCGQRVLIIAIEHTDRLLHDDRTMIEFLVDEMHGASRHFHALSECLLLRFEAGKSGQ